jgi:hypothetical protein
VRSGPWARTGKKEEPLEIQALKLLITEQDLNDVATRQTADDEELRQLRVRLTPEGAHVTGVYRMLVNVPFETRWELSVNQGKLVARLADLKALGLPGGMFKGMMMSFIGDFIRKEDAVQVDGETVHFNPDQLLLRQGLSLRSNLTGVRCQAGSLVIESVPLFSRDP